MRVSASELKERRWSGYVCPDCRGVFRVPTDHDGKGVVCPSCRRVLRIAEPTEETPPLISESETEGELETAWDAEPASSQVASDFQKSPVILWLGAAGVVVLILGGFASLRLLRHDSPRAVDSAAVPVLKAPSLTSSEALSEKTEAVAASEAEIFTPEKIREAQQVVASFFAAKTFDEAAASIFHPEKTRPRLVKSFPDGVFESGGKKITGEIYIANSQEPVASFPVQTEDYETKNIHLHFTPEGPKVDWEAWAAWSEMEWSDFTRDKPTTPVLFRIQLSAKDYYNFTFSDEKQWQSFQLESADGEHALSGYAARNSEIHSQLRRSLEAGSKQVTVLLKYPENASSSSQVIIDQVVRTNWLESHASP